MRLITYRDAFNNVYFMECIPVYCYPFPSGGGATRTRINQYNTIQFLSSKIERFKPSNPCKKTRKLPTTLQGGYFRDSLLFDFFYLTQKIVSNGSDKHKRKRKSIMRVWLPERCMLLFSITRSPVKKVLMSAYLMKVQTLQDTI